MDPLYNPPIDSEITDVPEKKEISFEERLLNQQESLKTLLAQVNDLTSRLRQCVSAMQVTQMLLGEISKGEDSTMTPKPDLQQVFDILTVPITDNYSVSRK